VLSLIVVPSFYLIMDDLSDLISRVARRFVGIKEQEPVVLSPESLSEAMEELQQTQNDLRGNLTTVTADLKERLEELERSAKRRKPTLAAE